MAFERKFTHIEKLRNTILFNDYLLPDIRKGEVFPAVRNEEIHFYYKGGRLFKYANDNFYTHIKYAFNSEIDLTDITESQLKNLKPINDFVTGYEKIKACCKVYSAKSESCNIAKLFKNYSYVISNEKNKVLLDIEAAMASKSDKKNIDRFDLVLFDNNNATLQISEAKLFSNSEIRAQKNRVPSVARQINRYEKNIADHKNDIITAYKNYVKIVNELFGCHLSEPEKINPNVNLLIFDFDALQEKKLKEEVDRIKANLNNDKHKICIRGNVGTDKDKTILEQLF